MSNAAAAFAAPPAAPPVAPPVAGPAAPPVAPPAAAPPAANEPNWYDGFQNADVKTWTAAKGFKDASAVAESAYNLEKLIGFQNAGRTVVVPKDDASAEERAAFNQKLGVPATAAEYKLPLPADADPKLVTAIQGWMHKAGATPSVASALTEQFVAFSAEQKKEQDTKLLDLSDRAMADTVTAWGKDADANMELAKRFTSSLLPEKVKLDDGTEVSRQDLIERVFNLTGATGAMLKLFAQAGSGLGEHKMRGGGDPGAGSDSAAGAQAKIAAFKADPVWVKAYLGGDKAKVEEMARLTALAYPAPT